MVDAPDPLRGPMYAWGLSRGLTAPLRRPLRGISGDHACAAAATCDPGDGRDATADRCCCRGAASVCDDEARARCLHERKRCALIARKPHSKDAATHWWALPLAVAEGAKGPDKRGAARVDEVRAAMATADAAARISFSEALRRLEAEDDPP